jgi:hypothetical protein
MNVPLQKETKYAYKKKHSSDHRRNSLACARPFHLGVVNITHFKTPYQQKLKTLQLQTS